MEVNRLEPTKEPMRLRYHYTTDHHYALTSERGDKGWIMELTLKPLPQPVEKRFEGKIPPRHVQSAVAYVATERGESVGWIVFSHEGWNNRVRVHELLVVEGFRRRGAGRALLAEAISYAKAKRARMVVLETQSCNIGAILFYLGQGFELVGFDSAAYSNDDIQKGEVRLEMGLPLLTSQLS